MAGTAIARTNTFCRSVAVDFWSSLCPREQVSERESCGRGPTPVHDWHPLSVVLWLASIWLFGSGTRSWSETRTAPECEPIAPFLSDLSTSLSGIHALIREVVRRRTTFVFSGCFGDWDLIYYYRPLVCHPSLRRWHPLHWKVWKSSVWVESVCPLLDWQSVWVYNC